MLVACDKSCAPVLALDVALLLVAGGAVIGAIVRVVLLAVLVWGYVRQSQRTKGRQ